MYKLDALTSNPVDILAAFSVDSIYSTYHKLSKNMSTSASSKEADDTTAKSNSTLDEGVILNDLNILSFVNSSLIQHRRLAAKLITLQQILIMQIQQHQARTRCLDILC